MRCTVRRARARGLSREISRAHLPSSLGGSRASRPPTTHAVTPCRPPPGSRWRPIRQQRAAASGRPAFNGRADWQQPGPRAYWTPVTPREPARGGGSMRGRTSAVGCASTERVRPCSGWRPARSDTRLGVLVVSLFRAARRGGRRPARPDAGGKRGCHARQLRHIIGPTITAAMSSARVAALADADAKANGGTPRIPGPSRARVAALAGHHSRARSRSRLRGSTAEPPAQRSRARGNPKDLALAVSLKLPAAFALKAKGAGQPIAARRRRSAISGAERSPGSGREVAVDFQRQPELLRAARVIHALISAPRARQPNSGRTVRRWSGRRGGGGQSVVRPWRRRTRAPSASGQVQASPRGYHGRAHVRSRRECSRLSACWEERRAGIRVHGPLFSSDPEPLDADCGLTVGYRGRPATHEAHRRPIETRRDSSRSSHAPHSAAHWVRRAPGPTLWRTGCAALEAARDTLRLGTRRSL